jgi:MYXO-CTERM domain-containing protein
VNRPNNGGNHGLWGLLGLVGLLGLRRPRSAEVIDMRREEGRRIA